MKWVIKPCGGRWVRRCPRCRTITAHETRPSEAWTCSQCHRINSPALDRLTRELAKELSGIRI